MTSQESAHGRFTRAIQQRNVFAAELAFREIGTPSLIDALDYLELLAETKLELVPIGLHECRHTFVSLIVAAGRSLEEVGDYVGHTSTYMTDRYRHLLDGTRTAAAAALDALLVGTGQ